MGVFKVRVLPNAKKNEIISNGDGDTVKIKLNAKPIDGKANAELVRFLADKSGVSKTDIKIVFGKNCRDKTVLVDGVDTWEEFIKE